MEIIIFEGQLMLGDGKGATMVFAQDFRVPECAMGERKLSILCTGVEILGPKEHLEISSHLVYLDNTLLGRLAGDVIDFALLPAVEAGLHRVSIQVSPFPGFGLCDDFTLRRVAFQCP
jgi:hypothetical protein